MNLRKLYISSQHKIRQFHVRFYKDGEIRAHDEISYEEDAISHINGVSIAHIPINEEKIIINAIENNITNRK
jgi:uncharacterized Zn finger protein